MTRKQLKDYTTLVIGGVIGWFVIHLIWTRWGEIKSAVRTLIGG